MILIKKNLALKSNQYIQKETQKTRIILHHTVGGSAESTVNYWASNQERVATAYIIERDGTIYECFDPKYWAYQIGKGSNDRDNATCIGIEMASEGALIESKGKLYKFAINEKNQYPIKEAYDYGKPYRGYRYFDVYDAPQLQSCIELVENLLSTFTTIPKKTPANHLDYLNNWKSYKGIVSHTHLREDKSDVHPGFPWARLIDHCGLVID